MLCRINRVVFRHGGRFASNWVRFEAPEHQASILKAIGDVDESIGSPEWLERAYGRLGQYSDDLLRRGAKADPLLGDFNYEISPGRFEALQRGIVKEEIGPLRRAHVLRQTPGSGKTRLELELGLGGVDTFLIHVAPQNKKKTWSKPFQKAVSVLEVLETIPKERSRQVLEVCEALLQSYVEVAVLAAESSLSEHELASDAPLTSLAMHRGQCFAVAALLAREESVGLEYTTEIFKKRLRADGALDSFKSVLSRLDRWIPRVLAARRSGRPVLTIDDIGRPVLAIDDIDVTRNQFASLFPPMEEGEFYYDNPPKDLFDALVKTSRAIMLPKLNVSLFVGTSFSINNAIDDILTPRGQFNYGVHSEPVLNFVKLDHIKEELQRVHGVSTCGVDALLQPLTGRPRILYEFLLPACWHGMSKDDLTAACKNAIDRGDKEFSDIVQNIGESEDASLRDLLKEVTVAYLLGASSAKVVNDRKTREAVMKASELGLLHIGDNYELEEVHLGPEPLLVRALCKYYMDHWASNVTKDDPIFQMILHPDKLRLKVPCGRADWNEGLFHCSMIRQMVDVGPNSSLLDLVGPMLPKDLEFPAEVLSSNTIQGLHTVPHSIPAWYVFSDTSSFASECKGIFAFCRMEGNAPFSFDDFRSYVPYAFFADNGAQSRSARILYMSKCYWESLQATDDHPEVKEKATNARKKWDEKYLSVRNFFSIVLIFNSDGFHPDAMAFANWWNSTLQGQNNPLLLLQLPRYMMPITKPNFYIF